MRPLIYGVVKLYNVEKGYGFAVVEGYDKDVFFHFSEVEFDSKSIQPGMRIEIDNIKRESKGFVARGIVVI